MILQQPAGEEGKIPSGVSASQGEDSFPSCRHLKWALVMLMLYFGGRLVYFAVTITPYAPPDEVTHFGKCMIYNHALFLPDNSPQSYPYGLVTNIPWLYYWIMGKALAVNIFGLQDIVFLRLLNIPLAFCTVYFVWRLLRILTDDRLTQLLLVTVMTNTIMFSFLSAAVSYDNLTNLLAAMALYYLFAFFKERDGNLLALSILCQLAGCLTKVTLLPLVLIMGLVLIVHERSALRRFPAACADFIRNAGRRTTLIMAALLVLLFLNAGLYGGNYLRYRSVNPSELDVLPLENALQYRLAARAYIFELFKEGRITAQQGMIMAQKISHPGDRADTLAMIDYYASRKFTMQPVMGVLAYQRIWFPNIIGTAFGIKGHLTMMNFGVGMVPLVVVIILSGIAFLIRWRIGDLGGLPACLAFISAAYSFYLMYGVNYGAYLDTLNPGVTLSGRYLFPIMGPLYILGSLYLARLFKGSKPRLWVVTVAIVVLVMNDFPFFLYHVTPDWFDWSP